MTAMLIIIKIQALDNHLKEILKRSALILIRTDEMLCPLYQLTYQAS